MLGLLDIILVCTLLRSPLHWVVDQTLFYISHSLTLLLTHWFLCSFLKFKKMGIATHGCEVPLKHLRSAQKCSWTMNVVLAECPRTFRDGAWWWSCSAMLSLQCSFISLFLLKPLIFYYSPTKITLFNFVSSIQVCLVELELEQRWLQQPLPRLSVVSIFNYTCPAQRKLQISKLSMCSDMT